MQYTLHLSEQHLKSLHAYAERCRPYEAPALLFGRAEQGELFVTRVELMKNTLESTAAFEIDPEEEYRLLVEAEQRGEEMLAIFHSHPAPPRPSSSDLANMRLNPVVWLIASRQQDHWESRPFILDGGKAVEVRMSIEEPDTY
ncbi:MAG: M67 family metallopeptidase [Candidatus Thorarchaeota archaeon]|nr:M67 family metallopeptidase [Candidatus Thorarchaeota archaeon]